MALTDCRSALVIGASSGIGAAVTRALLARGITVHAAARSRDRLARLSAETGCTVHVIDLADSTAVHDAFTDLHVDILIPAYP